MSAMSTRKTCRYCLVPGCSTNSVTAPEKKMFTLPADKTRRRAWLRAARRDPATTISGVCQDHFNLEEDLENFVWYKYYGNRRAILKREVVPHIFECQPDRKTAQKPCSRRTSEARARKNLVYELCKRCDSENRVLDSSLDKTTVPDGSIHPSDSGHKSDTETSSQCDISTTSEIRLSSPVDDNITCEASVQHTSGGCYVVTPTKNPDSQHTEFLTPRKLMGVFNLLYLSKGNKNVGTQTTFTPTADKTISAVPKTAEFSTNCNFFVRPVDNISMKTMENGSSPFRDPPSIDSFVPPRPSSSLTSSPSGLWDDGKLSEDVKFKALNVALNVTYFDPLHFFGIPKNQLPILTALANCVGTTEVNVMICSRKIRLNETFKDLGHSYGMLESNASKIFARYCPPISKFLAVVVKWPDPRKIKERLPIDFRSRYSKVQCLIDCFEVEIEKPSDPVKQTLTWSEYKKANTMKYLISCTPDALVTFVSKGFGGRTSDTKIAIKCGFIEAVPHGCHVMADRGFKGIAHPLSVKGCFLVRPPSVAAGKKSTKKEVQLTKQIASLRIHVERVIGKLRDFQMLKPHSCIDHNLIKYLDYATVIGCGLINLQEPISRIYV